MILRAQPFKEKMLEDLSKRQDIRAYVIVIQVGDNPASNKYIANKQKLMDAVGIKHRLIKLEEDVPQSRVEEVIKLVNGYCNVTGLMVQLPLPKGMDEEYLLSLISPEKDIDCLSEGSLGKLFNLDRCTAQPCTPKGIISLLNYYNIDVVGKDVCIVGRSNIVGASLGTILTKMGATVTICHSKTRNLARKTLLADIVICAIGKPKFFDSNYFNPDAVVIDVGINIDEKGKLCGDVDFDDVVNNVYAISPVPGGVGVMTVCSLIENTINLADKARQKIK